MGGVGGGQSPSADYFMSQVPANYTRATGIANQPFTPYTGQLTPGVPAAVGQAQTAAQATASFKPQQITAPTANAPTSNAASSGVFGLPQSGGLQMGASPAPAPASAMPSPMPTPTGDRRTDRLATRAARRTGTAPAQAGTTQPMSQAATGGAQPSVAAMQGLQGLDAYTNPFQQQVTDRTLAGLDQFRQMALNQNASGAAMSGAFSNDRLGVENALTNEGFARQAGDMLANMNMQGFNTGAGLLMGDKSSLQQNQQFNAGLSQQTNLANQQAKLQTTLANQQAGLTAGVANQGAATDAARINAVGAQTLGSLGGLQYGMQSNATDAAYQEFLRQMAYPAQQQDMLNKTLGMVGSTYSWQPAGHPFANAFLGNAGQSLGQGLGGGGSQAGLQLLGL